MLYNYFQPEPSNQAPQQKESQSRQHNNALHANHMIGHGIRVNRGGPDSVEGTLLAIPGDYLVLLSDNAITYVNGTHVKSITEGSRNGSGSGGKSGGGSRGSRTGKGSKSFITASSFQSLLGKLRHKHIQINRGGPEKLDGFLAEIYSENVLLIVDRELVRIPTFHIKNVCASAKNQNKNNNNNNKNDNNKNDNKNGNKSGNNKGNGKSGGNKGNNKSGGNKGSGKTGGSKSGGGKSGGNKGSGGKNKNKGSGRC